MLSLDRRLRISMLMALLLPILGCGGLEKESRAWRDQVQETVIALQESVDALAVAVPGERWARQMEALTHKDPAVRRRALDEIASGVGESLGRPLSVRAVIGTNDSSALRARFFLSPTNQLAELESFCQQGAFVSLDSWMSTATRPQTSEERRESARNKAEDFLNTVFGVPKMTPAVRRDTVNQPYFKVSWNPKPLGTDSPGWPPAIDASKIEQRRKKAISALADLMLLHYEEIALQNSGQEVQHDWTSTEGHGVLHAVVPASEIDRLSEIRAWIHEKGHPDSTWDGMTPRVLRRTSFSKVSDEISELCLPNEGEKLYWAAAELAGSVYHATPSAQVVQQLAKLRDSVEQLKVIYESERQ